MGTSCEALSEVLRRRLSTGLPRIRRFRRWEYKTAGRGVSCRGVKLPARIGGNICSDEIAGRFVLTGNSSTSCEKGNNRGKAWVEIARPGASYRTQFFLWAGLKPLTL
jgi:hypothetical protein